MKKITDLLKKRFTCSIEFVPPRNGADLESLFSKMELLRVIDLDFVSITKGAGGSLRGGTLPLSYFAHSRFTIPSIAHFTCREINSKEIESALVDLHYFGINNILALRGDPPMEGDDMEGDYNYAYELVENIKTTNEGHYLKRMGYDKESKKEYQDGSPTEFCIGVAAHPNSNPATRIKFLKKKVDCGADFAITQMIFDAELYKEFVREARDAGIDIPIIPGIIPIINRKRLKFIEETLSIPIPQELKEQFKDIPDSEFKEKGIELAIKLSKKLKNCGAPGVHLFIFQDLEAAKEIINALRK